MTSTSRRVEGPQRGADRGRRASTLHTSVDHRDAKREARLFELVQEVGFGCTAPAGDEPDPQWQLGQGTAGIGAQQPLCVEARQQLGPRHLELAQRVGGVDG